MMANPHPKSGYAFELSHADAARAGSWSRSRNDDWDIVMITPRHTSHYMWVGRRHIDGSEVNVWDDAHGHRYIAQTTVMTGRLLENQGSATPWVIGGLALAGLVWWLTSSKEAKAASSEGCPITSAMLGSFAKSKGYTPYMVDDPVSTWKDPKISKVGYGDPKARYLSTVDCVFYRWDGSKWVVDQTTSQEFITWANANVTKGPPRLIAHPANLFLF